MVLEDFLDANYYNDKTKEEIEKIINKIRKKLKKEKERLKIVGSQITDSNYISMKSTSEYNELKQLRMSLSIAIKSYKKQFADDIHFVDEVVVDNDFNKNLSYIQLIKLK